MLTNQTLSDFTADVPAHDGVGQVAHRRLNALVVLALMLFLSMRSSAKADLPPGWSDADIGAPTEAGSASESNGMWIVSGGGTERLTNAILSAWVAMAMARSSRRSPAFRIQI